MKLVRKNLVEGEATASELLALMTSDVLLGRAAETLLSSLTLIVRSGLPRSLLICSAHPEEGKTTLATILAMAAARAEKRVLLVDADLRHPRIHKIFGSENRVGFGEYLSGTATLDEVCTTQRVACERPQAGLELAVVPSGAHRRVDFNGVGHERFRTVINEMTSRADLVIVDCAPVLPVSDALFLASVVEGVVFLVGAGIVSRHEAQLAKQRLEQAGAKLLGFVMNQVDEHAPESGARSYHRNYHLRD